MYKQDMSSLLNQEQQLYQAICFSAEIQNPNKIKTRQLQEGGVLLHLSVQSVKRYKITCHRGNLKEAAIAIVIVIMDKKQEKLQDNLQLERIVKPARQNMSL